MYGSLAQRGDETRADFGELPEVGSFVGGQHGPVCGTRGGGDDEVVRAPLAAGALHMGQERSVVLGDVAVILVDGEDLQDLIEERALGSRAARVGIKESAGEVLRHDDGRYGHVVGVTKRGDVEVSADTGDDHTGVEDQARHASVSISAEAPSRAASTRVASVSSSAGLPCQRSSTARSAAPFARGAGVIAATRRPARVTTMVSPCSAESSTAEKLRDASDAVISRIGSEYQNQLFMLGLDCPSRDCRQCIADQQPQQGGGGVYDVELTADNGIDPDATLDVKITINEAVSIAGPRRVNFSSAVFDSFTPNITGFPAPTVTIVRGKLPPGSAVGPGNGDDQWRAEQPVWSNFAPQR